MAIAPDDPLLMRCSADDDISTMQFAGAHDVQRINSLLEFH
jgi:hypothetical protein